MKEKHGEFICIIWECDTDVEFVKGHVTKDEATKAVTHYHGEIDAPVVHGVKHKFARWVPASHYSDFGMMFHVYDEKGKGMFAVTECDVRGTR